MISKKIVINETNNEVNLVFNTRIYNASAVLKAAGIYSDVCWVNVDGDPKEEMQVVLKPKSKDVSLNTLGFAFYNHVLSLLKHSDDLQV